MKFKSYVGKQVLIEGKIFVFSSEVIETENDAEILALKNALDVEVIKTEKAKK